MYLFSLSYDDDLSNIFYFLALETFETRYKSLNKVIEMVNGAEMTIIKNEPLREFKLKTLLPKNDYLFDNKQLWREPIQYLSKIREFKANKKPLRFIVLRPQQNGNELFSGNLLVTLEDYTVNENFGEEGDFYIEFNLIEYKIIQGKKIKLNQPTNTGILKAQETVERPTKEPSKSCTVKKGDTLWQIAQKNLGNGDTWKEIAKKNNITNPNNLKIGSVLKL